MASTSSTSAQSQKANEQTKKPLLRSNDHVAIDGDSSDTRKRKTAPKSNETKRTGRQSKALGKGGTAGNRRGGGSKEQQKQAATRKKRKIPSRSAVATRTRSQLDERAEDPSPVALLDMLAEVASATLKNDPSIRTQLRRRRKMNTRSSRRQTRSVTGAAKNTRTGVLATKASKLPVQRRSTQPEQLSLDQIRMLSDKLLLNMFAEMTADEIKRNYTYSCFLLPEKCHQKYTSFGNENRARMQMKTHLLGHIAELLSEANAAGRAAQKGKFTAEPVTSRKRRLAVEQDSSPTIRRRGGAPQKAPKNSKTTGDPPVKKGRGKKILKLDISDSELEEEDEDANENDGNEEEEENEDDKKSLKSISSKNGSVLVVKNKMPKENGKPVTMSVTTKSPKEKESSSQQGAQEPISYEQPTHDHCYTTVDGGKNLPDHYDYEDDYDDSSEEGDGEYDEEDEEEEEVAEETGIKVAGLVPDLKKGVVVVSQMDEFPTGMSEEAQTTFRSKQAEMALKQLEAIRQIQLQKTKKVPRIMPVPPSVFFPPPPAPASVTKQTLLELEDELMDSDSERKALDKGSPEWERRLALKCIRMLRTKKKDEHVPLVCKICQGKRFTAQATLMYHYRSHAGIKPFLCTICNTTFTRQHSLNYHMLIHNNKSRFTCGDCGRKFRHPSHFKEHLRRHTGETPFECSDCGVRFKTRNTYKRHLKTRHGKLLTVNGIVMLSNEEFLLVKTNPKMKNQPRLKKDQETQWPEPMNSIIPTTSLNLKTMAMSNVPLMADIDSGMFLSANNNVRVQVVAEPAMSDRIGEITARNFIDDDGMMERTEEDEDTNGGMETEESAASGQYACISIGVGTEGSDAGGQNIIFLEAVPIESSKEGGEMEGQVQLADGESWTTNESFPNQEAIQAAVLLQPILQCM